VASVDRRRPRRRSGRAAATEPGTTSRLYEHGALRARQPRHRRLLRMARQRQHGLPTVSGLPSCGGRTQCARIVESGCKFTPPTRIEIALERRVRARHGARRPIVNYMRSTLDRSHTIQPIVTTTRHVVSTAGARRGGLVAPRSGPTKYSPTRTRSESWFAAPGRGAGTVKPPRRRNPRIAHCGRYEPCAAGPEPEPVCRYGSEARGAGRAA